MWKPFGFQNAPYTFYQTMDAALPTFRWQSASVYLNYIVFFFCSATEHVRSFEHRLTLLRDSGASLKLRKMPLSQGNQETMNFLRHVIRPRRLDIALHTTDTVKRLNSARNATDLKLVPGLCSVFIQFVLDFARIASLLDGKLRKYQLFIFELRRKRSNLWRVSKTFELCRRV